jgi:hypothetical protein
MPQQGQYKAKKDSCLPLLDAYTSCVAKHTQGLRQDEDCGSEAAAYKKCRKDEKDQSTKETKKT